MIFQISPELSIARNLSQA